VSRVFEGGQALLAIGDDLLASSLCPLLEGYEGCYLLSQVRIWRCNHR